MALTTVPYQDGLGTVRTLQVDITNGITTFVYQQIGGSGNSNVGIINGSNQWSIDSSGNGKVSFFGTSQPVFLLDGANPLSINSTGAALVRNISTQPFFINDFGLTSDAASSTGSLMARIRFYLVDTFGAVADVASITGTFMARVRAIATTLGLQADANSLNGSLISRIGSLVDSIGLQVDAASSTGSLMARLRNLLVDTVGATADTASAVTTLMARIRLIAQSYSQPNIFTRFGTSTTDTISGTPCKLLGSYIWNKSSSIRYIQFFNRTSNPPGGTVPLISRVLAPNEKYSLQSFDFGSNDGYNFSVGLAWGFSTTEGTYIAGTPTDITVEIYWR